MKSLHRAEDSEVWFRWRYSRVTSGRRGNGDWEDGQEDNYEWSEVEEQQCQSVCLVSSKGLVTSSVLRIIDQSRLEEFQIRADQAVNCNYIYTPHLPFAYHSPFLLGFQSPSRWSSITHISHHNPIQSIHDESLQPSAVTSSIDEGSTRWQKRFDFQSLTKLRLGHLLGHAYSSNQAFALYRISGVNRRTLVLRSTRQLNIVMTAFKLLKCQSRWRYGNGKKISSSKNQLSETR